MHIRFEKNANTKCDSDILSLSWMGRVPDNAEVRIQNIIEVLSIIVLLIHTYLYVSVVFDPIDFC